MCCYGMKTPHFIYRKRTQYIRILVVFLCREVFFSWKSQTFSSLHNVLSLIVPQERILCPLGKIPPVRSAVEESVGWLEPLLLLAVFVIKMESRLIRLVVLSQCSPKQNCLLLTAVGLKGCNSFSQLLELGHSKVGITSNTYFCFRWSE